MHLATFIFALTYLLISLGENSPRKLDRPTAALLGAVLMVMTGSLTRREAVAALDFSTLAVLFGMMVLLAVLRQSGLPAWLAMKALARCRGPHGLLALVVFASGIASAVMLNDTVCLLATPVLLEMTAEAAIPATPFLLALATSANIGSVANVIVAQGAQRSVRLGFLDFLWIGVPVTILTTAVGALALGAFFAWGWI